MGLIYSSGESAGLIKALASNLASGKEAINQLKSGSQQVVDAVDGQTLAGAAYTAGKGLFSELIIPTVTRVRSACKAIEEELKQYQSADQGISSEGYLNEDNLNQQIAAKKSMKASVDFASSVARTASRTNPVAAVLDSLLDLQRNLNHLSDSIQNDSEKLQKKIEKLHNFSSETNGLFSNSLDDMKIAMQGVLVLNGTVVNGDGSYTLPNGTDRSWFTGQKDTKALKNSPSYAVTNMSKDMTPEEEENWLFENLQKFGPDFLDYLKDGALSAVSFRNGRAFLNGVAISQESN